MGFLMSRRIFPGQLSLRKTKAVNDLYDPKTMEERRQVASRCKSELQYAIPTLVDDIDDSVNHSYAARPTRLYLIGIDGRVVYAGGLGPFGFKPRELKVAIETLLSVDEPAIDQAS